MSPRSLKTRMLERLVATQGWQTAEALAAGLSTSRLAIEDALADLVMEQKAEFMPAAGYRLKATDLCRQAARMLKTRNVERAVTGGQAGNVYRLAVAQIAEGDLVLFELEIPMPPEGPEQLPQHLLQVDAFLKFTTRGITA